MVKAMGELIDKEQLQKIVESAIEKTLFEGREVPDPNARGYHTTKKIASVADTAVDKVLRDAIKDIAVEAIEKVKPDLIKIAEAKLDDKIADLMMKMFVKRVTDIYDPWFGELTRQMESFSWAKSEMENALQRINNGH